MLHFQFEGAVSNQDRLVLNERSGFKVIKQLGSVLADKAVPFDVRDGMQDRDKTL